MTFDYLLLELKFIPQKVEKDRFAQYQIILEKTQRWTCVEITLEEYPNTQDWKQNNLVSIWIVQRPTLAESRQIERANVLLQVSYHKPQRFGKCIQESIEASQDATSGRMGWRQEGNSKTAWQQFCDVEVMACRFVSNRDEHQSTQRPKQDYRVLQPSWQNKAKKS